MVGPICRWGILGTAGIARKNWHSIRNSGNGTLVAVASRDKGKADAFIRDCQARVPYNQPPRAVTYDELLANQDVDAVYIPLPTAVRKEWVLRAARAGKHVVCEKPCGIHADDVAEMLETCRQQNVQFMDGVMFLHSRRLANLRRTLHDGTTIGSIRRIASQFSFNGGGEFLQNNIRVTSQLEPLGCLGDLGWYNIRFTLWVLNDERPEYVSGRILSTVKRSSNDTPVPVEFSGELLFEGGVSATFYCSFITELQQWADVSGTKGRLFLRDFVLPYYGCEASYDVWNDVFAIDGCQFNMEEHVRRESVREYSNNAPGSQESNLFHDFGELVLSNRIEPAWGDSILLTQQVLDACLRSSRSHGELVALK